MIEGEREGREREKERGGERGEREREEGGRVREDNIITYSNIQWACGYNGSPL